MPYDKLPVNFAVEFAVPCATFFMRPPIFPSDTRPETPSLMSCKNPIGLPRKSVDPENQMYC